MAGSRCTHIGGNIAYLFGYLRGDHISLIHGSIYVSTVFKSQLKGVCYEEGSLIAPYIISKVIPILNTDYRIFV